MSGARPGGDHFGGISERRSSGPVALMTCLTPRPVDSPCVRARPPGSDARRRPIRPPEAWRGLFRSPWSSFKKIHHRGTKEQRIELSVSCEPCVLCAFVVIWFTAPVSFSASISVTPGRLGWQSHDAVHHRHLPTPRRADRDSSSSAGRTRVRADGQAAAVGAGGDADALFSVGTTSLRRGRLASSHLSVPG